MDDNDNATPEGLSPEAVENLRKALAYPNSLGTYTFSIPDYFAEERKKLDRDLQETAKAVRRGAAEKRWFSIGALLLALGFAMIAAVFTAPVWARPWSLVVLSICGAMCLIGVYATLAAHTDLPLPEPRRETVTFWRIIEVAASLLIVATIVLVVLIRTDGTDVTRRFAVPKNSPQHQVHTRIAPGRKGYGK